ncbi:peroxisomal biogenesis factor 19 [Hermetia illucens]|nr:peroxisomal biogenesis factor 19 [Hermetia illucens]
MSDDKKAKPDVDEKELNDLLDNALKDFDSAQPGRSAPSGSSVGGGVADADATEMWNDDFFAEQAKLLGERVNAMFGEGASGPSEEQIQVGFQRMAEAAAMALQGAESDAGQKYADSIKETLKGLKEGVDELQAPVSENDLANMFSNVNLEGEGEGDLNPFLPFMQGMMQTLLSPEILLPSMKELSEKFPQYLEENGDKIDAADKERYEKQQELFAVICKDLEEEKPDDSANVKKERFGRVLQNMQKLHEYGQPPADLIGDVEGGAQCPLM